MRMIHIVKDESSRTHPSTPDPVIEHYKRGIDRTLLRQNLERTPEERVRNHTALQRMAEELRRAGRESRR